MTYTIDQVKRLVPEAEGIEQYSNGNIMFWLNGMAGDTSDKYVIALLTTRAQLAIARAALESLDKGFYCHKMTIREAQREIRKALDAIKQAGEEK